VKALSGCLFLLPLVGTGHAVQNTEKIHGLASPFDPHRPNTAQCAAKFPRGMFQRFFANRRHDAERFRQRFDPRRHIDRVADGRHLQALRVADCADHDGPLVHTNTDSQRSRRPL